MSEKEIEDLFDFYKEEIKNLETWSKKTLEKYRKRTIEQIKKDIKYSIDSIKKLKRNPLYLHSGGVGYKMVLEDVYYHEKRIIYLLKVLLEKIKRS